MKKRKWNIWCWPLFWNHERKNLLNRKNVKKKNPKERLTQFQEKALLRLEKKDVLQRGQKVYQLRRRELQWFERNCCSCGNLRLVLRRSGRRCRCADGTVRWLFLTDFGSLKSCVIQLSYCARIWKWCVTALSLLPALLQQPAGDCNSWLQLLEMHTDPKAVTHQNWGSGLSLSIRNPTKGFSISRHKASLLSPDSIMSILCGPTKATVQNIQVHPGTKLSFFFFFFLPDVLLGRSHSGEWDGSIQ